MAEFSGFEFLFDNDPERAKQRERREQRLAMGADEFRRSVNRMIQETPTEHLMTLRILFHQGLTPETGEYLCGLIIGHLQWVRGACVQCGEPSHEKTAEPCIESSTTT